MERNVSGNLDYRSISVGVASMHCCEVRGVPFDFENGLLQAKIETD